MALVKLLKTSNPGWRVGDHVELFGDDLKNHVVNGWCEVIVPDKVEVVKEEVQKEEPIEEKPIVVKVKSKKKGG